MMLCTMGYLQLNWSAIHSFFERELWVIVDVSWVIFTLTTRITISFSVARFTCYHDHNGSFIFFARFLSSICLSALRWYFGPMVVSGGRALHVLHFGQSPSGVRRLAWKSSTGLYTRQLVHNFLPHISSVVISDSMMCRHGIHTDMPGATLDLPHPTHFIGIPS